MMIDYFSPEAWIHLSDDLNKAFGADGENLRVRPYQTAHHALAEITKGLSKLFPTRKSIFYMKSFDPVVEPHMTALAREGYQLNPLEERDLSHPKAIMEKMNPRETLFCLVSHSDPMLGLKFPVEDLCAVLKEKKIFSIHLSHAEHIYQPAPDAVEKQECLIHSFGKKGALGFLGARFRVLPLISEGLDWSGWHIQDFLNSYGTSLNEAAVTEFEADPPEKGRALLVDRERIKDRAVLTWEDLDGTALMELLCEKLSLEMESPGENSLIETTSLSRWEGLKTMDWLKVHDLTERQIRGTLILSQNLLSHSTLKKALHESLEEIYRLQG